MREARDSLTRALHLVDERERLDMRGGIRLDFDALDRTVTFNRRDRFHDGTTFTQQEGLEILRHFERVAGEDNCTRFSLYIFDIRDGRLKVGDPCRW